MPLTLPTIRIKDDEPRPFGVILTLVEPAVADRIITGRAKNDFSQAYGYNPSFIVNDAFGAISLSLTVQNMGEVSSHASYVWLVVQLSGGAVKLARLRMPLKVDSKNSAEFKALVMFAQLGISDPSSIVNIYAIAIDPLLDPLEAPMKEYLKLVEAGDFAACMAVNPCRVSRRVASLTLSTQPFEVAGGIIKHQKGMCDIVLKSFHADLDAAFGIIGPDGNPNYLVGNLHGRPLNQVLHTMELPSGEVTFCLGTGTGIRLSTTPQHCQIRLSHGLLELDWEDASDGSFGDYVLQIIHR